MNVIPILSKESELFSELQLRNVIYLYLLSTVKVERGNLLSEHEVGDLHSRFKFFESVDVAQALRELEDSSVILIKKGKIQVGTVSDSVKKLFYGKDADCSKDYEAILKYAEEFISSTKSSVRTNMARKVLSDLQTMRDKALPEMTTKDFIFLFRACYEAVMQDYHREFVSREFGQMKNFQSLYDNVTAVKMIIHFCIHFSKYSKTLNVASLTFHKDSIYTAVKGKTKKEEKHHESGF